MGIEPTPPAWKAGVLPLNYARLTAEHKPDQSAEPINLNPRQTESVRWGRQDSNLRRLRHQIYSLAHLAALEHPPQRLQLQQQKRTASRSNTRLP